MKLVCAILANLLAMASWGLASSDWWYLTNASNEAVIIQYLGSSRTLVIPATLDGRVVREIGPDWPYTGYWLQSIQSATNVIIPDSVTRIKDEAFKGCTDLSRVTIGSGVTNVGNRVFADCTNLESVLFLGNAPNDPGNIFDNIDSSEWDYYTNASNEAIIYRYLGSSRTLIIPETLDGRVVREIGPDWPYSQYWLPSIQSATNVIIPDSVTRIKDEAFKGCTDLSRVTIGSGVTNVGNGVFADCTNLESVLFLGNVPNDPGNVFDNISNAGIVYYLESGTGWSTAYSGWPTAIGTNYAVISDQRVVYHLENATGWSDVYSRWPTTTGSDSDNDGLSDAAEIAMASLGFDYQEAQPNLVATLYENANIARLFTLSQYQNSRTSGQADVVSNAASYNFYTSNSITDLNLCRVTLRKQDTNAEVVFQLQTTEDLASGFTDHGPPITNSVPMSGGKGFVRIKALEGQ
ncbi:MAG: leucine-rich repeat domain-containing protein [Chthoniobacterales bacterium]